MTINGCWSTCIAHCDVWLIRCLCLNPWTTFQNYGIYGESGRQFLANLFCCISMHVAIDSHNMECAPIKNPWLDSDTRWCNWVLINIKDDCSITTRMEVKACTLGVWLLGCCLHPRCPWDGNGICNSNWSVSKHLHSQLVTLHNV